ncbi:RNA polymerase sigma factor [Thalassotalea fusca]
MDCKSTSKLKLQLLILRAQSGCESGFQELFGLFKGYTFKYLNTLLGQTDAEDVQQQIWFKVYQQLPSLSNPYGFRRWLTQIAHRAALDHLKLNKKHVVSFEPEVEVQGLDKTFQINIPQNFELLHKALNKLSFEHKEVILLFYWQEFTCVEIAQILNCNVGTVKSRLFNARQQLQRYESITQT